MKLADCGVAQIFDFAVDGEKIWFTEWVENNIGVVDTSIPLPLEIQLDSNELSLTPGSSQPLNFVVSAKPVNEVLGVSLILSPTNEFLNVEVLMDSPKSFQLVPGSPVSISTTISASESAVPGTYKILLGAQSPEIAISKYVTVTIE
jgi:virginiamycin B lyase